MISYFVNPLCVEVRSNQHQKHCLGIGLIIFEICFMFCLSVHSCVDVFECIIMLSTLASGNDLMTMTFSAHFSKLIGIFSRKKKINLQIWPLFLSLKCLCNVHFRLILPFEALVASFQFFKYFKNFENYSWLLTLESQCIPVLG